MQSHPYQEGSSLQALIQTSQATPDSIQVKPKGFKVILQSTIEFLETNHLQATLLAKLPAGSTWQEDIDRYCQIMEHNNGLFLFKRSPDAAPVEGAMDTIVSITVGLPNSQTWRGEYFLLLLVEGLTILVTAYRIQTTSALDLAETDDDAPDPPYPADIEQGESANRRPYLAVCSSVNPAFLTEFMATLRGELDNCIYAERHRPAIMLLQRQLQGRLSQPETLLTNMSLLDRWIVWQLKQQEHLRQSVSTYRRQAMTASSLSSQNEVLINTLRIKDDFLNTIGQEFRTPLATIKTALTLLGSPSLKGPQRQRYLDMISHECDRQSALISGVLNLLQMENSVGEVSLSPLRLVDTVPAIVSTYQPLAQERDILLAYTIPANLPTVACPETWLRQIVIHLLNNGIKYTESSGEVWVTARQVGDFAEIEVRDTGIGISAADLPHIFDHFYRGRNLPSDKTEGAGLGLSIVQQLLMYCGGSIRVKSQTGEGTCFRVRLPLYSEATAEIFRERQ